MLSVDRVGLPASAARPTGSYFGKCLSAFAVFRCATKNQIGNARPFRLHWGMEEKPTLINFARAFRDHWFAAMSGAVSVPFSIATAVVADNYAKTIFAVLTFFSAFFACYRIWRAERIKVREIQEKLEAIDPLLLERKAIVDRAFLGFGSQEIEWLDRFNIAGRPSGCPDEVWSALELSGLVDRDFTGPKGIKEELRSAVAEALAERKTLITALEIVVSPSSKYREIKTDPHGATEHLFIGVRNSHPTKRITNCRVSTRLPENVSVYSYLLKDGFALEANDEKLIGVAYFRKFAQETQVPDVIRISTPPSGTFAQQPTLPIEASIISFEASATEAQSRKIICSIRLDERRRLQMDLLK